MTSSPTVFIMRSSRASAMRTDLTVEVPAAACFAAFLKAAADYVFNTMLNGSQSFQTDLCGGAFYCVNGAKQFVDLFRIIVAFKRDKAIADDLKVFLRFRLEELQYLIRNLVVRRQRIEVRA